MRTLLKMMLLIFLCLVLLLALALAWLWPRYAYAPAVQPPVDLVRFAGNPIIASDSHPRLSPGQSEGGYANINGPSVIRVPGWVENPLGNYYLYFAHHKGDYIRMAYAEHPTGPWTLYEPGTLQLADSGLPVNTAQIGPNTSLADLWRTFSVHIVRDYLMLARRSQVVDQKIREQRGIAAAANASVHIASPEVLVDQRSKRLLMYFHGMGPDGYQRSAIAQSHDGIDFTALDSPVFSTYLRAFELRGEHFLLGMPGVLYRSGDPDRGFVPRDRLLFDPGMRHCSLWVEGDTLHVVWSRVGDAPERLLYSRVDMSPANWNDWLATRAVELLRPELPWEGSELPVLSSIRGEMSVKSNELRDPYVFRDEDGKLYLYYIGAGEQAMGVALLHPGH